MTPDLPGPLQGRILDGFSFAGTPCHLPITDTLLSPMRRQIGRRGLCDTHLRNLIFFSTLCVSCAETGEISLRGRGSG
jgi:hypothetical protein